MGRIKDLRDKVAKGDASEEEKVELEELQSEAAAGESQESEEEAIERLADAMVSKIGAKFDKLTDQLDKKSPPPP
jgi:hypothetical protein